ncbi:hypothetical protein LVD13_08770 [Flavobacteriaceae bacterium D16]|nr:hypothetical protein [Flavobacteriaceae bacterium D16]
MKRTYTLTLGLFFIAFTTLLGQPENAMGQGDSGQQTSSPIDGTWTRVAGNNSRANGMKVKIASSRGIMIDAAKTRLKKGDLKWKNIRQTGKNTFEHQELGSNYSYYDGRMTYNGGDTLYISVGASGQGNQQLWIRPAGSTSLAPLKNSSNELSSVGSIMQKASEQKPVIAYGYQGEAILLNSNRRYQANDKVPEELKQVLFSFLQKGNVITDIEFNPAGGWVIATNKQVFARNVGGSFLNMASEVYKAGKYVSDLEFNPENWDSKRGFRFADNTGNVYSDEKISINFDRRDEIQPLPRETQEDNPIKGKRIRYTFRYDWLSVIESNDLGLVVKGLDLYGHGDLEFWVAHDGITIRMDKYCDFSTGTADRYKGEVFNIERANAVTLKISEAIALSQNEVVINIDLDKDFNGLSLKEFEAGAYLDLELRMSEADLTLSVVGLIDEDYADDRFPVVRKRIYLEEADIKPMRSSILYSVARASIANESNESIMKTRYKDDEIAVSYSLVREILE